MDTERPPSTPEFGPRGYLPERAAKRARKIVLREQMGSGWPLAALVAAAVVAVAGVWYVVTATGAPSAPYVAVSELTAIEAGTAATFATEPGQPDVLVVRAAGGVQAFVAPEGGEVAFCAESGRLESSERTVWTPDGRLVGGDGASLAPLSVRVYDGAVYVDPSTAQQPPDPTPRGETPTCR